VIHFFEASKYQACKSILSFQRYLLCSSRALSLEVPLMDDSQAPTDAMSASLESPKCAICLEPYIRVARLMPYGHEFCLDCMKVLLAEFEHRDKYPMCRASPTQIYYTFNKSGKYRVHDCKYQIDFPNIVDMVKSTSDKRLPIMTEADRKRTFLVERIRARDPYCNKYDLKPWLRAYDVDEDSYTVVVRSLGLKINQTNLDTVSTLSRELSIYILRKAHFSDELHAQYTDEPPQSAIVAKALLERDTILADLSSLGERIEYITLQEADRGGLQNEKGLFASVRKEFNIERKLRTGVFQLVSSTILMEGMVSTCALMEPNNMLDDRVDFVEDGEKAVRMARMEVQGALETVMRLDPQWGKEKDLEVSTTGVLETFGKLECEYCELAHRNGDCLLPPPGAPVT